MTTKVIQSEQYVSFIKVKGISLLPPLITAERRAELLECKQRAMEIERCLRSKQDFKQLVGLIESKKQIQLKPDGVSTVISKSLEQMLSFDNSIHNDDALDDTSSSNEEIYVPSNMKRNLTCHVFDVIQYSDKGMTSFKTVKHHDTMKSNAATSINVVEEENMRPRLLRSNSYIVDTPSPILLEHLQKQPEPSHQYAFDDLTDISSTALKIVEPENYPFDEDYVVSVENVGFNEPIQPVVEDFFFDVNVTQEPSDAIYDERKTDVALQAVINNNCYSQELVEFDRRSEDAKIKRLNLTEIMSGISEISNKSHVDNTQSASSSNSCNLMNQSTSFLIDLEMDSCEEHSQYMADPSSAQGCYDNYQHLYFNSEDTQTDTPNSKSSEPTQTDRVKVLLRYSEPTQTTQNTNRVSEETQTKLRRGGSYSAKEERKCREKWAATILTAAAKGFLIRRLKQTEHVRNLIQTIQDTLMCAMSLHKEDSHKIRPRDVELHRRLIQQVSSTCLEFHGVFFKTTPQEKMKIIRIDRQRQLDKLKRPKSNTSLKLELGQSTPKSQRHSWDMRQRRNLMPSYAA